jgi:serine/threonine-protein kinase
MICPRCHLRYDADHLFCGRDGERLVEVVDIKRIRSKPTEAQGQLIGGRYQVRGLLGKGAMAQVYLALDRQRQEPVALKVMDTRHTTDKRLVARFIQEAKAIAAVVHPSIVEMLDVGLGEDGSPYLVMELLLGETLGERLRRDKALPPRVGLPFVRQIAEALAVVHHAGIVHRDVKPDNVFLVGEKGDPHSTKLLDFGYAKLGKQGNLTQVGIAVGTIEYMSPEQAVSDTVDPRADVYGLGVLAYRMFSGRLPFSAGHEAGGRPAPSGPDAASLDASGDTTLILAKQLAEDPPSLTLAAEAAGAAPGVALGLSAIVRKMLHKSPDNRYASMEAFIGDLTRLDRGEALAARLPPGVDDVYVPHQAFAQQAATFLHRKLGKEPPR